MSALALDRVARRIAFLGALSLRLRGACYWCGSRGEACRSGACSSSGKAAPATRDPMADIVQGLLLETREAYGLIVRHRKACRGPNVLRDFHREQKKRRGRAFSVCPTGRAWRWAPAHGALRSAILELRTFCEAAANRSKDKHAAAALRVVSGAALDWAEVLGAPLGIPPSERRWYRGSPILRDVLDSRRKPEGDPAPPRVYRISRMVA